MGKPVGTEAKMNRIQEGLDEKNVTAKVFLATAYGIAYAESGTVMEALEAAAQCFNIDVNKPNRRRL